MRFTITAEASEQEGFVQPPLMLASLDAVADAMQQEDVTVSLVPATVVEDSGRSQLVEQANIAFTDEGSSQNTVTDSDTVVPVIEGNEGESDEVMTQWDDAIWEEESGTQSPPSVDAGVAVVAEESDNGKGWLAGLTLLTPSIFRRRRKKD